MDKKDLITIINQELSIELPEKTATGKLRQRLSEHINHLIANDFQKLVGLLYRVDVNEKKLKSLLKENPDEDAGNIIADLIIERQLQKIKSRKESKSDKEIPDDEKW